MFLIERGLAFSDPRTMYNRLMDGYLDSILWIRVVEQRLIRRTNDRIRNAYV
jgi:hypothetical protein